MHDRFCSVPDDYTTLGTKYDNDLDQLEIWIQDHHSDISHDDQHKALDDAIGMWVPHVPFDMVNVLANTSTPDNTHIQVRHVAGDHGDGHPFDGPNGTLAHATPPPLGWLHMDADELWGIADTDRGFNMRTVYAHELGHNLGLGHSGVPGALMFPRYTGALLTLRDDDIAGIRTLYKMENAPNPGPGLGPHTFWGEDVQLDGKLVTEGIIHLGDTNVTHAVTIQDHLWHFTLQDVGTMPDGVWFALQTSTFTTSPIGPVAATAFGVTQVRLNFASPSTPPGTLEARVALMEAKLNAIHDGTA